jgi:hypothetical protein
MANSRYRRTLATLALLSAAAAGAVHAGAPGPATEAIQIRFGGFFPAGGGDLWDENEDVFTLNVSDLDNIVFGFGWVHSISNEIELGFGIDFYDEWSRSFYRDWVDEDGFPIFHDTGLELMPMTVDIRFLPGGRHRIRAHGRRVMKPVFYVGAGIGSVYWEYEEVGDFLDFTVDPPEIFPGHFYDDGFAFEIHGLAGVELPLGRTTYFTIEGRYADADDDLGGSFAGIGDIELGGVSLYGGFSFRF